MQQAKQLQRSPLLQRIPILAREEHNRRLGLGSALQVVQHVVRTAVGEHLTDSRDQILLDAQDVLQSFQQLFFFYFSLNGKQVIPEVALLTAALPPLEQLHGQVIQVDFQNLDTSSLKTGNTHARQPSYQLP